MVVVLVSILRLQNTIFHVYVKLHLITTKFHNTGIEWDQGIALNAHFTFWHRVLCIHALL